MAKEKKPKVDPLVAESIETAGPERLGCSLCRLHETCKTPFIRPWVPRDWTGCLLLVGEGPGADEDKAGRPFVGRAGKLLYAMLREAGFREDDAALHNAVICRPPGNRNPSMREVRACRGFLLDTIQRLQPRYVIGLGTIAAKALTNQGDVSVTSLRGRPLEVPGLWIHPPVYLTYHPAAILHGFVELREEIVKDFKRVGLPFLAEPEELPPGEGSRVIAGDMEWDKQGNVIVAGVSNGTLAYATPDPRVLGPVLRTAQFLVAHSAPQDIEKMILAGMPVREEWAQGRRVLDSLTLARMANENLSSYELENLLSSFALVPGWKAETKKVLEETGDAAAVERMELVRRCRLDAWAAFKIAEKFRPELRDQGRLIEFTQRIASSLSRMSLAGAVVDTHYFNTMGEELYARMVEAKDRLRKAAYAEGMTEFEPTNDNHIRDLLYTRLGLKPIDTTPTGLYSIDKVSLQNIEHPVTKLLLEYNRAEKLYSTNIGEADGDTGVRHLLSPIGLVDNVPVSLLEFHFNPLGARTGRRSSSNPNSQNWTDSVRRIIRSRFTDGRIGAFDYSKLEPIILGWIAGEGYLMDRFLDGTGYIGIAKDMWGHPVEDGTPLYRAIKAIILGVHYDMRTAHMAWDLWNQGIRFSDDYDTHEEETDRLREGYLSLIPRVVEYMDRQEDRLLRNQCVVSPSGRVRRLPMVEDPQTGKIIGFHHARKQAINFPVQSFASDVTGAALIDIERDLLGARGLGYRDYIGLLQSVRRKALTQTGDAGIIYKELEMSVPFNEVHDELTWDLNPETRRRDEEIIMENMMAVRTLRRMVPRFDLPLKVTPKIGKRWGEKTE